MFNKDTTLGEVLEASNLEYNEYNTCGWYLDEDLTQVADLDMIVDTETSLFTKTVSEEMLEALNITPLDTNSQQVMSMAFNIRALEEQVETNTATFAISAESLVSRLAIFSANSLSIAWSLAIAYALGSAATYLSAIVPNFL